MMRKVLMVAIPAIVALLASEALLPERTASAQAQVPVFGDGPIPSNPWFRSWSLFLVCNPEWLLEQHVSDLWEVFTAYTAFGRTSGSHHAAVWFVTSKSGGTPVDVAQDPRSLDIERSVTYCQRFGLRPSEGPHIVVTTVHPDRWTRDGATPTGAGDPIVVLSLGGSRPADVVELLKKLNDQVLAEHLSQQELASIAYWQSWLRIFDKACHLFDRVKFTVTAKVFSIEKTGVCK